MIRALLALIAVLTTVIACAPPAPSAPAPAAAGPQAGAAPAASGAVSGEEAYRQQIVDAARAEGEVNAVIQSSWTPEGLKQLEEAIQREYGIAIKINHTPVQNYPQRVAELSSELAAGTTPSFDVYQTSDANALSMLKQDLLEPVNWGPLLPQETPPAIVKADNRLLVVYTDHIGLMYDPTIVAESEVPRSLKDLANPKWRNKVVMMQYTTSYVPYVMKLGREPTLAALRAAIQNGAVTDIFANEYTRFAAKEYPLAVIDGTYYLTAQLKGIPAAWAPLDFSYNSEHFVAVGRKVAHPNAARLLASVLVGPEGQRIAEQQLGFGSRYYEGSGDYKIEQAALAAGFPTFSWHENPDVGEFTLSPEGLELQREIDQIFHGG
ncbi:MAG TPA: extracellular solute-binding protein [Chloroflexota bacterium]|jgi:iron(III) transport system substrate-binding protein